jgi:transcriptional regulator with XRE-family HTH domain
MTTNDNQLGMSVAARRTLAGMTQAGLAKLMKAQGHAWVQSTVSAIERGAQPLRAVELISLAELFEVAVEDMVEDDGLADVRLVDRRFWDAASVLANAVIDMRHVMREVAAIDADALPDMLGDRIRIDQAYTVAALVAEDEAEANQLLSGGVA